VSTAPRARTQWLRAALLLAVSGAASLALAECGVRALVPQPIGFSWLTADGLEVHVPGRHAVYQRSEFSAPVRFNTLGFRGGEFAIPKPPGTFRILALGDSYVEAMQVAEPDAMTNRIERALAGGPRPVEVLNLGVSGHGTDDALDVLRTYGPRLEPDLVLLVFCLANDLENNLLEERCQLTGAGVTCREPERPSPRRLVFAHAKSWLSTSSQLYQATRAAFTSPFWQRIGLRAQVAQTSGAAMPFGHDLYRDPAPAYLQSALALTQGLLGALRNEAAQHGAELWILLVPLRDQVEDPRWSALAVEEPTLLRDQPQRAITAIAEANGLPVVDPLPAFRALDSAGTRLFWRIDGHLDATGQRVIAEQVVAALHARDLPGGRKP